MDNNIKKLAMLLGVAEITEYYKTNIDLEISEWNTADGYSLHVITQDSRNLDFEYDVYYYEPSFNQIIDRIKEMDRDSVIFVADIELYLPDSEVQDYIDEHTDEDDE